MLEIRLVYASPRLGWVGLVQRDGAELYRTGGYHPSAEGALERCSEWLEEQG